MQIGASPELRTANSVDWIPRFVGRRFAAVDEGFAPESDEHASLLIENLLDLPDRKATLILGAPGAGKSVAMRILEDHLNAQPSTPYVFRVDLREFSSESSIEKAIDELRALRPDQEKAAYLLLDSIDETRQIIRNFVPFLARELGQLTREGWHVIATCRTAETVPALDDLFDGFQEDALRALLPLRRTDAADVIERYGLDAHEALTAVDRLAIAPLAALPLTLDLICEALQIQSDAPLDRTTLFTRSVESALSRLSTGENRTDSLLNAPMLRRIALERLAAFVALTNPVGVALFKPMESSTGLQTELVAGPEWYEGAHFDVSNRELQQVLGTSLFAESGPNEMQFSHRTIRDFLAARCIIRWGLPRETIRSIIVSSTGLTSIPPQMLDIATWLVALDTDQFEWLLEMDPLTLARNAIGAYVPSRVPMIVNLLLEREKEIDSVLSWQDSLAGLAHNGLASQLRKSMLDPGGQARLALRILRDSYAPGLEAELIAIANNAAFAIVDRKSAIDILSTQRQSDSLAAVAIESASFFEGDANAELRGSVLSAMWPGILSFDRVLQLLVSPPESFFGMYQFFLFNLERQLDVTQARAVLRWCADKTNQIGSRQSGALIDVSNHSLRSLISKAAATVAQSTDAIDPPTWDALIEVLAGFMGTTSAKLPISKSLVDVDRWRDLVRSLVSAQPSGNPQWYSIVVARDVDGVSMVEATDLGWIAGAAEVSKDHSEGWMRIFEALVDVSDPEQTAIAWTFEKTPLWKFIEHRFSTVELDSQVARDGREAFHHSREPGSGANPRLTENEYVARVTEVFEATKISAREFWSLSRWLDVDLKTARYNWGTNGDPMSTPSALLLPKAIRDEILGQAIAYIGCSDLDLFPTRIRRNTRYYGHIAAYRAAYSLAMYRPDSLKDLDSADWGRLVTAILSADLSYDWADADHQVRRRLIRLAMDVNPQATRRESLKYLTRAALGHSGHSAVRDLEEIVDDSWFEDLTAVLPLARQSVFSEIVETASAANAVKMQTWAISRLKNSTSGLDAIFIYLFAHDPDEAVAMLIDFIQSRPSVAKPVLLEMARLERRETRQLLGVSVSQRLMLYAGIRDLFPTASDPIVSGMHAITAREDISEWRDSLLQGVVVAGSKDAVDALSDLASERPDLDLDRAVKLAKESLRQSGWSPLAIIELRGIVERVGTRLVRNEDDLLSIVLAELEVLQRWLVGETPQAFALWNWTTALESPKDETALSDWYCHSLRTRLADTGLVINREVQVRNRPGASVGLRQDIRVEIRNPDTQESFVLVIEVKGIWNPDLRSNLLTQLVDDYLRPARISHGIYLVVEFDPDHIAEQHRKSAAKRNVKDLLRHLLVQAESVAPELVVAPVIHVANLDWAETS